MSDYFWSQTNVISSHIEFNIFCQAWPIVLLANQLSSLVNLKMPHKWIIVVLVDDLEINNFWHIRKALVVEHPVDLLQSFLQLCGFDFLSLQVYFL